MSESTQQAPACPGCHFGCNIARYQCARGKEFYAKWEAGEPIPQRRPPWKRQGEQQAANREKRSRQDAQSAQDGSSPQNDARKAHAGDAKPKQGHPSMPPNAKLMHMLTIASAAMADHKETRIDRLVADTITRHSGAATSAIIRGRTNLDKDALAAAINHLCADGLIEAQADEVAGTMYSLTDEGKTQAAAWREERLASEAEFSDALSDEEKNQLAELIGKMLRSTAHQKRMR